MTTDLFICRRRLCGGNDPLEGNNQTMYEVFDPIEPYDPERVEKLVQALKNCKRQFWDDYHSGMSLKRFNNEPIIEEIDAALKAYGEKNV